MSRHVKMWRKIVIDYGHWDTNLVYLFNPADYYGFVYLVTNTKTGRMYIGKKSMWSTVTKKVWKVDHSEKKNTKVTKESEWRSYTTSSKSINAEIFAGEIFTFQILSLHTSKGTLAYNEVEQMVMRDVLRLKFANGDRVYYNGCIPGIKFLPSEESFAKISAKLTGRNLSDEHKQKLCKPKKAFARTPTHCANITKGQTGKVRGPSKKYTCNFCNDEFDKGNLKQFHNEHCESNPNRLKDNHPRGMLNKKHSEESKIDMAAPRYSCIKCHHQSTLNYYNKHKCKDLK